MDRACESCFRRKVKCSRSCPCEECQRRGNKCVPRSRLDRRKETIVLTTSTGTCAERSQNGDIYAGQSSTESLRMSEVPASESTVRDQWSGSNLGHALIATIPCDNIAKHGPPITCPANVTSHEKWNIIRKICDSSLPWETSANTGWRAPCNAFISPDSYMSTDNLTGEPMPDPWFSPPWYKETGLQTTLFEPFRGWDRSQSRYLIGSETNVSSHSPIPAQQLRGPFEGGAEESWYPNTRDIMPIRGAHLQEQYPPGPSFDLPELIPSSVAVGLSSIPETVSPSFPGFPRVQQVEEASLALPTESLMLSPPWDSLATIPAKAHIADIRSRSLHQQPSSPIPIQNIEALVPPWLYNAMGYQGTEVKPFGNVGANSQELSLDVTVPEDQVEHGHLT
ncbi:hypothetical protein AAWM_07319 [Aspergillus awamori]|uniref:Zn(2)-C6 fungal-type domain-containing protein n=1 Tax=Aspergillus awamori TaxID=105351 RepID=A0A401KYV5_ASPAW|nr:hypothetical protein AAWM_07319 [Aspergillus awamori]